MRHRRARADRGSGRLAVVVAVSVLATAVMAAGPTVVPGLAGSPAGAGIAESAWDPRIADLVPVVERLRGLEFARPVPVKVLGDAAFERRLLGDEAPTRKDREKWDETQDAFIAMGLLEERIPFDDAQEAGGASVAGFYDPVREAIVVRGSTLDDPSTRVTLVHELTHALQDQHFDLQAIQRRAAKADSLFTRALVEGDATDVEQRYFAQLDADEQREATASVAESLAEATALPPFLEAIFYAPYLMGAESVRTLRAVGGQDRLDEVMRRPPTRDLGLVDPTALSGAPDWESVPTPELDEGDAARGKPFPMDALGIYLVLAERLGWSDALDLAEAWGGDQAVTFVRAGRPCVRMDIRGRDGAGDAAVLGDGFRRWAAAGGTDTDVAERGDTVEVTLCEPAVATGVAPTAPAQALVGLSLRNGLFAEIVGSGSIPERVAKCTADGLVRLPEVDAAVRSIASVTDELPDATAVALRDAIGDNAVQILGDCRSAA